MTIEETLNAALEKYLKNRSKMIDNLVLEFMLRKKVNAEDVILIEEMFGDGKIAIYPDLKANHPHPVREDV